jgi:hypothetical protein
MERIVISVVLAKLALFVKEHTAIVVADFVVGFAFGILVGHYLAI